MASKFRHGRSAQGFNASTQRRFGASICANKAHYALPLRRETQHDKTNRRRQSEPNGQQYDEPNRLRHTLVFSEHEIMTAGRYPSFDAKIHIASRISSGALRSLPNTLLRPQLPSPSTRNPPSRTKSPAMRFNTSGTCHYNRNPPFVARVSRNSKYWQRFAVVNGRLE